MSLRTRITLLLYRIREWPHDRHLVPWCPMCRHYRGTR